MDEKRDNAQDEPAPLLMHDALFSISTLNAGHLCFEANWRRTAFRCASMAAVSGKRTETDMVADAMDSSRVSTAAVEQQTGPVYMLPPIKIYV